MKKRTFLKLSAATLTGTALTQFISCSSDKRGNQVSLKNWAGNLQYSTRSIIEPASVEEVREAIKSAPKLRALGTRHCFNTIADSDSILLSTSKLNNVITIDAENASVTVEGGIRYGEFCKQIHEAGFAIHNLASLPHISVAGACATGTHGSGVKNGNLATSISSLEVVNGKGEVVTLSRKKEPDSFNGAVVNLGCLGVVTRMTLDLVPTFNIRQDVYLNLPMQQLEKNFAEIMSAGYSVSLFTDWQTDKINQVWKKSIAGEDEQLQGQREFFGAVAADKDVHPIIELSAENCTVQMGIPGPWYERLPHFKMGFTPSSGEELQAEYFVPMEKAVDAIQAIGSLREEIKPYILITEIRSIASDNLWVSPCCDQPSIAIHFTLRQDIEGVNQLLPKIEAKLEPFNPKPHWGKLFSIPPRTLQSKYNKLSDFRKLVNDFDPEGKFRNDFVEQIIFGS